MTMVDDTELDWHPIRLSPQNFFDNAETYGDGVAETLMGLAIRRGGWRRSGAWSCVVRVTLAPVLRFPLFTATTDARQCR